MKFSVIIVNDTGGGDLQRALKAIAAQTQRDFEVLVAGAQCALPDERFKNIETDTTNPLAAKNVLAELAAGEWLFFLTPRSFLSDDCLESLYAATLRHPDCAMFAVTQLENSQPSIIAAAGKCYAFAGIPFCGGKGWPCDVLPDEGEVFGACTPAIFVRKNAFLDIGKFDADFENTCEDADLSFRLRLAGHKAILASEAIVFVDDVFVDERSHAKNAHRLAARNIIWTYLKNMPVGLMWLTLPFHVASLLLLLCSPAYGFARLNGFLEALETLPRLLQKRKIIQSTRKVSLSVIAHAFTWNPNIPFWHRTDIRKLKSK